MSDLPAAGLQIDRSEILKAKRICRFCLTQNEPLYNIYSKENRIKNSAPLPLQVISCISMEVFTNDGMPSTICENCTASMDYYYKFKQMCKKADNLLRQFPLTGKWPKALEYPKIPADIISNIKTESGLRNSQLSISSSSKMSVSPTEKKPPILNTSPSLASQHYQEIIIKPATSQVTSIQAASIGRPKVLNKNFTRILNKEAQEQKEPMLTPVVKRYDDMGNVEIVTEIIDQSQTQKYEEKDPIKNAAPVETNVFPCPHCERSFPLKQLLDIHVINHTRERSFKCVVCDKRFFSKYDLGKHVLIHTGEKPYQCVVCNKAFTRSTLLYRHEKVHTDMPKLLCVYCEKPFLSKSELDKHIERHMKKRPFSCKFCGKSFAFKQGLERHEVVHAKNQPFPCEYCDQSFPTPSKLARHLTAHAGERPFPCRLCPNSYLLSHHLTRHMRSHNQGSGSYRCYDCGVNFKTRDDLIYHSAVHATQSLICPLCKEQFETLDLVTEHIKLHAEGEQYACEFCDLIFMTAKKLQDHCDVEHSEDLAAYAADAKKQIALKKEKEENEAAAAASGINDYSEDSQDDQSLQHQQEGVEVIEEFIIEEYHQDDENINYDNEGNQIDNGNTEESIESEENENIVLKEEPIETNKEIKIISSSQKAAPRILNAQQKVKTVGNTTIKPQLRQALKRPLKQQEPHVSEDEEYPEMIIEALERDDESENNIEIEDEEKFEEPPKKMVKLGSHTSLQKQSKKQEKYIPVTTRKSPRGTPSTSSPGTSSPSASKTTDSRKEEVSVASYLQQIPKSVTIVKKTQKDKEKTSVIETVSSVNAPAKRASPESKDSEASQEKAKRRIVTQTRPESEKPESSQSQQQKVSPVQKSVTKPNVISMKQQIAKKQQQQQQQQQRVSRKQQENKEQAQQEVPKTRKTEMKTTPSPQQQKLHSKDSGKRNVNENNEPTPVKDAISSTGKTTQQSNKKPVEMMLIGDRKVAVQKIRMTKEEVAAMTKEGKIEIKDGTMILKQSPTTKGEKSIGGVRRPPEKLEKDK